MKSSSTASGAIARHLSSLSVFAAGLLFLAIAAAKQPPLIHGDSAPPVEPIVLEGVLGVLYGDPMPGSGQRSQKVFTLYADDGRTYELDFSRATLPDEGISALVRKRIRVRVHPEASLKSGSPVLRVDDARVMVQPEPQSFGPGSMKATGVLPYISLLCRFSDDANEPRPTSFFTTQYANTSPGFRHYFSEVSYNTVDLTGSTATAWASLGQPRSYFINGTRGANDNPSTYGDGYLKMIFNACTAAHNATVNFAAYYGINIMLNGQLENAAWGGCMGATLDGASRCWPTTWMPYHGETNRFGWRQHSILGHEMSHAFQAPHSEDPAGNEYGSSWDVTSNPGASCATVDTNYGCHSQHMNAYAKTIMGAIGGSRIATHNTGTATYNVERLAQPQNAPSTYQMVRVNIAGTSTRWYTIESRHRTGYDAQLYGDGVIIHEISTTRSNDARLVVPGQGNTAGQGGLAAIWQPGMFFQSAADNVRITVNSYDAGTGTASVTVAPYTAVTDTFPAACTGMPAGWTVPAGATTGWAASTSSFAEGTCSLRSNTLADPPNDGTRYRAEIQYTGTFIAGNITFWAKVSAEPRWDCLRFTIDNVQQNLGSCTSGGGLGLTSSNAFADTGWRFFSIPVTAGTHTVKWSYDKDYFAAGADAAWIDAVVFPTAASTADLAVTHAANVTSVGTGRDVVFTMSATNNGPSTATGVAITATYDPTALVIWASPGCTAGSGTYVCSVGSLNSAATSSQFKLVLRKDGAGTMSNSAAVAGSTLDANTANNTVNVNVPVNASPAAVQVQRYRLYSPVTLEHHFTTDLNEYTVLGTLVGTWVQEGTVGKVLNNPGSFGGVQAVPYYRLYDNNTRWHHWTTDANEYYTLSVLFPWWNGEGVDGWILPTSAPGSVQLYRLLYPFVAGLHHWTIDTNEYNTLISTYGWIGEGGSGFVIP